MVYKTYYEAYINELDKSNLKSILMEYDIDSLFGGLYSYPTTPAFAIEVVITSASNMDSSKFGTNKKVNEKIIKQIIKDANDIIQKTSNFGLPFLKFIRMSRPVWFTFPEYSSLLKPFNNEIKDKIGLELNLINQMFDKALEYDYKRWDFDPILNITNDLTIHYSKCKTMADLWDYLFIRFDEFSISLTNKISDTIYNTICSKLQRSVPNFGNRKGKSLENYVFQKVSKFMPTFKIMQNYYINDIEKDILIFNKNVGIAIECKSVKIRKSSVDWSTLNARDDFIPIKIALDQIHEPLNVLENGGKIKDNRGNIHKLSPKKVFFGLVITDQIYTSEIRSILDIFIEKPFAKNKHNPLLKHWHGEKVWVGSFIDFHFLLKVTQTPSLLLDYLQFVRSKLSTVLTEDPEAWVIYALSEHLLPLLTNKTINLMVNKGFPWNDAKENGFDEYAPYWCNRFPQIIDLDSKDLTLQAIQIATQDRNKAIRNKIKEWEKRRQSPPS